MNEIMEFVSNLVDRNLRCEYHDYVNGRCVHCGKVRIRNAIAIIGKDEEQVKEVGDTMVRISKKKI